MSAPILLVVDDTPASLGVVCDALRQQGVRVLLAESGVAARQVLARTLPDLILLDVVMPDEDGFAVCAALRVDPRWRDLPVIFLTAIDAPEQKVRAFSLGAVDYVTKPVHVPELIARARVQLDLQAARRALENQTLNSRRRSRCGSTPRNSLPPPSIARWPCWRGAGSSSSPRDSRTRSWQNSRSLPAALAHGGRFVTRDGALHARRFTEPGRDDTVMLVLEEEHAPPGPASLRALGLTPRQAEVAYWVAQGKTNAEVAVILGASPRTIDKHMERILARVGLENRALLIVSAGEILRGKPAPGSR
jgi:DNA-binding response OmpR family regulator/DNA-binding CsgD family transcriptional regulator